MAWTEQLIHFIDFEGGVACGVLEYGRVALRGGRVIATDTGLCAPRGRIRPEDMAVHGLDEATLAGRRPFADEFERFASWRETGPLAAHFASAENTLIKATWPYARKAPDFARLPPEPGVSAEWGPWLDSARLAGAAFGPGVPARLEDLVRTLGLQAELDAVAAEACPADRRRYHAALYDALAGALVLCRIAALPDWSGRSLPWMLEQSTLDAERRERLRQGELF